MKVKEIDRTANLAWSPASQHPIYLAAGTAAQQLDATFSTTAALEIYALNLTEPGLDMSMKGSVVSDHRFHALAWGGSGMVVGGADGGNLLMYDASKLLQGDDPLVHQSTKHTGPVHSLDFNSFQECLLASGASESEIFIWDLNNPSAPVTLGAKSQPLEEVCCVSWNCQVQHILASAFPARCVVWDLRKNEPVIKVADSASRLRCKVVCWHPEVATQLCLASEDDLSPLIQLWDLRFATSPLKTLQQHQRGVLSVAWCPQDPDLLLSCGKDSRILCWNPNSNVPNGEVVCELCTGGQWSFDVAWCPRNPALIASASCDGRVSVFSLMGGQQQTQPSSKIAESFPGSETLGTPESLERPPVTVPLKKPPKWLRKPAGAAFAFGGRLVSLIDGSHTVRVSCVVSEPELLEKAQQLETALSHNALQDFCAERSEKDPKHQIAWRFLQATFSSSARTQMLSLLGYNFEAVTTEVNLALKEKDGDSSNLNEEFSNLSAGDGENAFDIIASQSSEEPLRIQADASDIDGLVCRALLTGNLSGAVDLCISEGRWADALVLAQSGGQDLLQRTQKRYFASVRTNAAKLISSVVTSDWVNMVKQCDIKCWKEIFAAILTYAKPEHFKPLCELLGRRLEADPDLCEFASLCYIGAFNLELLAQWWVKKNANPDVYALQGLVEQIMVLRSSGGAGPLDSAGSLTGLLADYAQMLAAQGSLSSAANYLLDVNERSLMILKDRIYESMGQRSPAFPFEKVNVRRPSTVPQQSSVQSHAPAPAQIYNNVQPQYSYGMTSQPNSFNYSSPPSVYHQPVAPPMVQSPPPAMMMPPQTVQQSPPPIPTMESSAESSKTRQNSGNSHLSHRYPKHVHDPSLYSQPQYYQPSYPQQPYYEPSVPSNFPSNQPTSTFQPVAPTIQPLAPTNQQNVSTNQPPAPSVQQTAQPFQQPGSYSNASCYGDSKPGWNDPPLIKQQPTKAPPSNYEAPTPITRPFPDVPEQVVAPPAGYFAPQYNSMGGMPPPQMPQENPQPPQQKVCEVVRPIPPEHQVLQDTFEDLRRQCQRVATNPQIKRKLDDVAKKLEHLYDKLRDATISSGVSTGLHQMAQYSLQSDYPSALAIHGQTSASANFTETSGFMPCLKVLLQTAAQLNVSLR